VLRWFKSRRSPRIAAREKVDPALWQRLFARLPLLARLTPDERLRLQDLALAFLREKAIEEVKGVKLDLRMRLTIALQACLPVLYLGLDWYRSWYAVIVYPDAFVPAREVVDENGLVWIDDSVKSGEAWFQGPVILSWTDVAAARVCDGYNVVVHEMAHKLDLASGYADGHPPLHAGMSDGAWDQALGAAYEDLVDRDDRGEETWLDPYAAESPAEFFAVASEAFFELPAELAEHYPAVYEQLAAFYRQDPRSA